MAEQLSAIAAEGPVGPAVLGGRGLRASLDLLATRRPWRLLLLSLALLSGRLWLPPRSEARRQRGYPAGSLLLVERAAVAAAARAAAVDAHARLEAREEALTGLLLLWQGRGRACDGRPVDDYRLLARSRRVLAQHRVEASSVLLALVGLLLLERAAPGPDEQAAELALLRNLRNVLHARRAPANLHFTW